MATITEIKKLMSCLKNGESCAIQASDLSKQMGLDPSPNQESLRAIIRGAIDNGELIGSSRCGYWKIGTVEELDNVLDSLESRARGVCDRRNNLLKNWNKSNPRHKSMKQQKNIC